MFRLGGATAVFTNRFGGVSKEPYDSLNVSYDVGDDPAAVTANRDRINEAIGHDVMWMKEGQTNRVHLVQPGRTDELIHADGLILDARPFYELGLSIPAIGVLVGDCLPILLGTKDGSVVAAIHAGRAGVVTGIVREAMKIMREIGVDPRELHAAVGPSICGKCYEVSLDLQKYVTTHVPASWSRTRWGTPGLDLRSAAVNQLQMSGVTVSFISKRCTYEDPHLYSFRRDKTTGRFAGIAIPKTRQKEDI